MRVDLHQPEIRALCFEWLYLVRDAHRGGDVREQARNFLVSLIAVGVNREWAEYTLDGFEAGYDETDRVLRWSPDVDFGIRVNPLPGRQGMAEWCTMIREVEITRTRKLHRVAVHFVNHEVVVRRKDVITALALAEEEALVVASLRTLRKAFQAWCNTQPLHALETAVTLHESPVRSPVYEGMTVDDVAFWMDAVEEQLG